MPHATNLTTLFLKPCGAVPREGHTVVVLEQVGDDGERFHSLIEPGGEAAKKTLVERMRGSPPFPAFAVPRAPENFETIEAPVRLSDQVSTFTLSIRLSFRVVDPAALVAHRSRDPISLIRDRISEVLVAEVRALAWQEVLNDFRSAGVRLVERRVTELQEFAAPYGIALNRITLSEHLPPDLLATLRKRAEAEAKAEAEEIDTNLKLKVIAEAARVEEAERELEIRRRAAEAERIRVDEEIERLRAETDNRLRAAEVERLAAEEKVARAKRETEARQQELEAAMARAEAASKAEIEEIQATMRLKVIAEAARVEEAERELENRRRAAEAKRIQVDEEIERLRAETENRLREAEVARVAAEEKVERARREAEARQKELAATLLQAELTLKLAEQRTNQALQRDAFVASEEARLEEMKAEARQKELAATLLQAEQTLSIAKLRNEQALQKEAALASQQTRLDEMEAQYGLKLAELEQKRLLLEQGGSVFLAEGQFQVQETVRAGLIQAIQQIAAGVTTPAELIEAIQSGQLITQSLGSRSGMGPGEGEALAAVRTPLLPGSSWSGPTQRLSALLGEMLELTEKAKTSTRRAELRAALLRVFADGLWPNGVGRHASAEHTGTLIDALELSEGSTAHSRLRVLADADQVGTALE
jgi:regulator of protease activity HflC (stomatin/prohibitin superfamily)